MERLRSKLEKIALNHFSEKSIYGLEEDVIQLKKLNNVKEVHNIENEEILFLHDDTLFGSAKDGMVFGEESIYWREKFKSAEKLNYTDIVQSTANRDIGSRSIFIFNEEDPIELNDMYYNVISELKEELINSFPRYESFYQDSIISIEKLLMELEEKEEFSQIIELIGKYEGLFLKEEDKSDKIREITFKAYVNMKLFNEAAEELEKIKKEKIEYYKEYKLILEKAIKESQYDDLEHGRILAMEREDYEDAYLIFNQQRDLNIKEEKYLAIVELEIKEAHYNSLDKERLESLHDLDYERAYSLLESQKQIKIRTTSEIDKIIESMKLHEYESLDKERLKAVEKEEYNIAFILLKKQKRLEIKTEEEIEKNRISIEKSKKEVLERYHEELKELLDSKLFIESQEKINRIYQIEPSYYLEREEILLMIYKYKLDEAREAILKLSNLSLQSELKNILEMNSKTLYEEIRIAARNKDYNYFEFFPHIWNYKDEYSMSALDYFALEGDSEGLMMALEKTDHTVLHANIFGHNFLDLLGFACDSRLGNSKESLLDILYRIKYFVKNNEVKNRIKFIKTGQEGSFFSYNIFEETLKNIQEKEIIKIEKLRLEEYNERLMSTTYFNEVYKDLKNKLKKNSLDEEDNIEVKKDMIIKDIFLKELENKDDYPRKGEFEISIEYNSRCKAFSQESLKELEFIEEYKRYNKISMDEMVKSLEYPGRYYISSLMAFVDYTKKSLETLKNLESTEAFLELFLLYFPIKPPYVEIGNYDSEKEVFFMIVNDEVVEMSVPLKIAEEFKESFYDLEFNFHRLLHEDSIIDICIYEFQDNKIMLPFKERYNILNLEL